MPLTDVYCPICFKTEFVNVKSLDNFDHRSLHGDRSAIFNYDSDEENYRLAQQLHHQKHHVHPQQAHNHRFSMYGQEMSKREARIKTWIQQSKQHTFARIKILNNFDVRAKKEPPVYGFVKAPVKARRVTKPVRRQREDEETPKAIMPDEEDDYQQQSPFPSIVSPSTSELFTKREPSFLSPVQENLRSRESNRKLPLPLPSQSPGLPANFFKNSKVMNTASSVDNLTPVKNKPGKPALYRSTSFIEEKKERTPPAEPGDFKVKTPERRSQLKRREKSPLMFSYDEVLERLKTPVMKKISDSTRKASPPTVKERKPVSPIRVEKKRVVRKRRSPSPVLLELASVEPKPRKKRAKSLSPVLPVVVEKRQQQPKARTQRSPEPVKREKPVQRKPRRRSPTPSPERKPSKPRKEKPARQSTPTPSPEPEPERKRSKPRKEKPAKQRTPTPSPEPEQERKRSKPRRKRSPEERRTPPPSPEQEEMAPEPEKREPKPKKTPRRRTPTPSPEPKKEKTPTTPMETEQKFEQEPIKEPPPEPEPVKIESKPKKTPRRRTPTPSPEPQKTSRKRRSPEANRSPSPEPERRERKPRRKRTRTPTPSPSPEPVRRERKHRIRRREKQRSPTPAESPEPRPRREKPKRREKSPELASSPEIKLPEIAPSVKKEKRKSEPELLQLPQIVKAAEEEDEQMPADIQMSKSLRTKIRSARITANDKDIQTDIYELIHQKGPHLSRDHSNMGTSPIENITPISPIPKQNTFASIALSPIHQQDETMNEITSTPAPVSKKGKHSQATSPLGDRQSILDNLSPINEHLHLTEKDMQTEDAPSKHDMATEPMMLDFHTTGTEPMVLDPLMADNNADAESEVNSDHSGSTINHGRYPKHRSRRRQRRVYKQIEYHNHYYGSPREESVEKPKKPTVSDTGCSPLPVVEKHEDIVISLTKEGHTNIIEVTQQKNTADNKLNNKKGKGGIKEDPSPSFVLPQQAAFIYDDDARSDTSSSSRPVTSHSQKRPQVVPNPNIVHTADDAKYADETIVFKLEDLAKDDAYLEEKRYAQGEDENNLLRRPLSTIEEDDIDEEDGRLRNSLSSRVKLVKLKDLQSSLNQINEDEEAESTSLAPPSHRSSSKHVTFDNVDENLLLKKKRANVLPREKEISSREKAQLFVEDNFTNRYIGKRHSYKRESDSEYPSDDQQQQNDELISNPTIRITSAKSIASKSDNLSVLSEPASRFNVRFKNRPNVFKKSVEKAEKENNEAAAAAAATKRGGKVSYVNLNDTGRTPRSAPEKKGEIDEDIELVQRLLEETDLLNPNAEPQEQQQQYAYYPSSAPPQMQYHVDQNGNMYAAAMPEYYYYPQSALPYSNLPNDGQQQYYYYEQQPYMQPQPYTPMYMPTPTPTEEHTIVIHKSPAPERVNTASSPIKAFNAAKKKPEAPAFIISNNSNKPVFIRDNKPLAKNHKL